MSQQGSETKPVEREALQIATATPGHVRTLILKGFQPVLLLGAGASVTSGIPVAENTVEKAARWAWCDEQGRNAEDIRIQRSDYYPWLCKQKWFNPEASLADQYPLAMTNLLPVKRTRRDFFEKLISPGVPPSDGYKSLVKILNEGWIHTVLTTNFDHCVDSAKVIENKPHMLVTIKTPADLVRFSAAPSAPQLVYIHGSVEHYSDQNSVGETDALDPQIVERVAPLLRDHPVVVVGYRGAEKSVMNDLFLKQIEATNKFVQGVYWCVREGTTPEKLPPMVRELASKIGQNFCLVETRGFDELFHHDLWNRLRAEGAQPIVKPGAYRPVDFPDDMAGVDGASFADLDGKTLQARLTQYAKRLGLPVTSPVDEQWQRKEGVARNLLLENNRQVIPTVAGLLLFGRAPQARFPQAQVTFKAQGPQAWIVRCFGEDAGNGEPDKDGNVTIEQDIAGNLWSQLDNLTELLSLVNQGFRLKEEESRTVYPFAPVAIKEVLVNALVHRDYKRPEAILVLVTSSTLEVVSPGGLIPEVAAQTEGKTLETVVTGGTRGIKGYRNPVISDLFYGGGQMDRSGSGLADIWTQTVNNNGEVRFGPDDSNQNFLVTLFARPESVDEVTNTAVPLATETIRYAANILPIHEIPQFVWHAGTSATSAGRLARQASEFGLVLPKGYIQDGRFFSFFNLEEIADRNTTPFAGDDIEKLSVNELLELPNGENVLLKLLNDAMTEHLRSKGLVVDFARRRAHFSKGQEREVKITYRGRVKRATRTVVKARTRRSSDDVLYYEHKAMSFSIVMFGDSWGVIVTPGYTFTRDGDRKPIGRDRVNILSTKRAARDFNPSVHHDVTFWAAIISGGTDGIFALEFEAGNALAEFGPQVLLSRQLPTVVFNTASAGRADIDDELDAELEELENELAKLAEEEPDEEETSEEESGE